MVNDKGEPTRLALMANAWGTKVPKTREEAQAIAARGRKILESTKKSSVDPSVVLQEHDKMPRSYMAYSNLHNVQEDAGQLEHLMNPQDDLPQWADQMLARAQDNVADVLDYVRAEKSAEDAPWENPKKPTGKKLTEGQKEKAERKAKAAGRPYPNLIDNMNVAKQAFALEPGAYDSGSQAAFAAVFGRTE
jgi:cell division protein FtsN